MSKVLTNLEWHKCDEKPTRMSYVIMLREWKKELAYEYNIDFGVTLYVNERDFDSPNYDVLAWAYTPDAKGLKELMSDDEEVCFDIKN